ncbi:C40 family peptidase [Prosthecomicrobium sp. N25]|uniref:C40 family peptidase n=1 Tax=Prosthecomicrobium sp. N25 TaxID=3129254 RepID=UPI0030777746
MAQNHPRLTPARPDLAAAHLAGLVPAERYVAGARAHVIDGVAPVRREPRPDAALDTEALFGEAVTVYDEDAEGWAWVQLERDGYVGYLPSSALLKGERPAPTHRVSALRSFVFPGPSIKEPPLAWISLGSEVAIRREIEERGRRFGVTANGGCIVMQHLATIGSVEPDPVAVAERFLGAPYLWGGKSSLGLDCSGLVQTALRACGHRVPRDTDMQEAEVGIEVGTDPAAWRRGDLLFWPGHVAFVRDGGTILHANAFQMMVGIEATDAALARIEASGTPLRSVRRVG